MCSYRCHVDRGTSIQQRHYHAIVLACTHEGRPPTQLQAYRHANTTVTTHTSETKPCIRYGKAHTLMAKVSLVIMIVVGRGFGDQTLAGCTVTRATVLKGRWQVGFIARMHVSDAVRDQVVSELAIQFCPATGGEYWAWSGEWHGTSYLRLVHIGSSSQKPVHDGKVTAIRRNHQRRATIGLYATHTPVGN
jgi:hypothetical protein